MLEVISLMLAPIVLMGLANFFTFFQPDWPFVPLRVMPAVLMIVFCTNVLGCASVGGALGRVIGGGSTWQGYACLVLGALIGASIAAGMAWAGFRLHRWQERKLQELKRLLKKKKELLEEK